MFSRLETRNFLILALLVVGIFSLAACANDSDVTSPLETDTQIQAAGIWLPTAEVMVTTTSANESQEKGLRQARNRWGSAESESPEQGFLLEASTFLNNDQMVQLVKLIAEQREEHPSRGVQNDAPRHGQRGMREGKGPREGILEYAEELGLTEDQVAALTALREEMKEEHQGMREGRGRHGRGQGLTDEQRAEAEGLREAHQAKVKEILTDEQWTKFEELRAEQREARREAREEQGMERQQQHLDFLAELLQLTDEQREAIETLMAEQHEQIQALSDEFREGLDGERPTEEQRTAHFEAVEAIRTQSQGAILELLDEDQAELFTALSESRPEHRGPRGRR